MEKDRDGASGTLGGAGKGRTGDQRGEGDEGGGGHDGNGGGKEVERDMWRSGDEDEEKSV